MWLKIKNIRRRKRIKQRKLSELVGLTFRKYNLVERGKMRLTPILLARIITELEIDCAEFNKSLGL